MNMFSDFRRNLKNLIEELHTYEKKILQQLLHHINVLLCKYDLNVFELFILLNFFYMIKTNIVVRRLMNMY